MAKYDKELERLSKIELVDADYVRKRIQSLKRNYRKVLCYHCDKPIYPEDADKIVYSYTSRGSEIFLCEKCAAKRFGGATHGKGRKTKSRKAKQD